MSSEFTKELNVEEGAGIALWESFREFIESLRSQLRDQRRSARSGLPVLPPEQNPPTAWFHVRLQNNDPNHAITLRIRADNLYLHGYQRANSNEWFELRTRDGPQLIQDSQPLGFDGSYNSLAAAGSVETIQSINIGRYPLMNAVTVLATSTERDGQRRARSLVVVILMICESIRFEEIANHFVTSRETSMPDVRMVTLVRSWGDLSDRLLRADAYADHTFPLPAPNALQIMTAQDATRILGILIGYYCIRHVGTRRFSRMAIEEEEHSVGRPLMEVMSVIINDIDGEEPGQLYGTITVTDGLGSQSIYNRARGNYEDVYPGNAASLTDLARAISALGWITIDLDLLDKDSLSPDDQVSKGTIYWGDFDVNKEYDKLLQRRVPGQYGSATVNYIVFSDAVEAKIEVRLIKGDDMYTDEVYGKIVSRIGDRGIQSVLFFREKNDYIKVSHGELIPLSRTVVAAPLSYPLEVTATLYDHDSLSPDDEIANGSAYFRAKPSGTSKESIRGKYGEIEVKVTWNPPTS